MFKQPYYPPIEESEYEGINDDWRYGYMFFLALLFGIAALAYLALGGDALFNHGFPDNTVAMKPALRSETSAPKNTIISLNPFLPALAVMREMAEAGKQQGHHSVTAQNPKTVKPTPPVHKQTEPEKYLILPEPSLTGKFR